MNNTEEMDVQTKKRSQKGPLDSLFTSLGKTGEGRLIKQSGGLFSDIEKTALKIAVDLACELTEKFEELDTMNRNFREGLRRCVKNALVVVSKREEDCVVIPNTMPGFTAMVFKKRAFGGASEEASSGLEDLARSQAASLMVQAYLKRKGDARVLAVEGEDVLFIFFPVEDTKKNLMEAGMWFV